MRRCHGDLHLKNVALIEGRPVIFDALEFSETLAPTDTAYDLAFVIMDLWVRGHERAASRLLNRYVALNRDDDLGALALMPLFLSMRAAIRANVDGASAEHLDGDDCHAIEAEARRMLQAAIDFLAPAPARLVAVGGLSGTGKSTLAASLTSDLGRAPGALHLHSDVERKALAGVPETERLPDDAYTRQSSDAVYGRLYEKAARVLAAGQLVALDAVFARGDEREAIKQIARQAGAFFRRPLARRARRRYDRTGRTKARRCLRCKCTRGAKPAWLRDRRDRLGTRQRFRDAGGDAVAGAGCTFNWKESRMTGKEPTLKRGLGLTLTTLYGLGVVVGAGIYVLIGAVAQASGIYAPVAFLVAAIVAGVTAFSYTELSARLPEAAGEAAYADQAFGFGWLTLAIGLALVLSATVTGAAVGVGATGYVRALVEIDRSIVLIVLFAVLGAVAIYGIIESVAVAAIMTLIELAGLLLIVIGGVVAQPDMLGRIGEIIPPLAVGTAGPILAGGVLAFFAFIGFEDMVNVAEEVRDPERTLPKAIILTLVISTLLYVGVSVVAVLAVPTAELAESEAPLSTIAEQGIGFGRNVIAVIAIIAALNGILVQMIMAPRVLYGLARRGRLPAWFATINATTRTPLRATLLIVVVMSLLALTLPISELAEFTSKINLMIFMVVNAALIRLKQLDPDPAKIPVPVWVPWLGLVLTIGLFAVSIAG